MRIGFVHTQASLVERFRADVVKQQPGMDAFHILNEGPMQGLSRGEPRQLIYGRMVRQLRLAVDEGADLVVLTCSCTTPAVDLARSMSLVPILNGADPMAAEAVRLGRRIALISSDTISPGPGAALLRQHAAAQGREVIVETVVRPEAYTALFAGDPARHDTILLEAAWEAAPRVDVLVLCQAALGHLQKPLGETGKPVLTSIPLLMNELSRRLASQQGAV